MATDEPEINITALNRALEWRGWTSAKLSKESGVSTGMISLILQGGRPNASAVVVAKLARALAVSIDFLMGLTENPLPHADMGRAVADLLEAARNLPESRQRDLLLMANTYAEAGEPTVETIEAILDAVEKISGEEGVNELLDLLEGLLPPGSRGRTSKGTE